MSDERRQRIAGIFSHLKKLNALRPTSSTAYATLIDRLLVDLETREELPEALLRLAGFEASAAADADFADDLLLSKEVNEEQLRVAARLQRHGSVLVQGPPGTGKTHTIANLLGHLLAEGRNVLVTAHTSKALRVLREQVDAGVRALCMSVLESDAESNELLNESVRTIAARLSTDDAESLAAEIGEMQGERIELLARLEQERERLRAARFAEIDPLIFAGRSLQPVAAAREVAAGVGAHDWIPGPVVAETGLPVSEDEVIRLYRANVTISVADEEELAEPLPDATLLTEPDEFRRYVEVRREVQERGVKATRDLWQEVEEMPTAARLDSVMAQLAEVVRPITDAGPWVDRVIAAGKRRGPELASWKELIGLSRRHAEEIARAEQLVSQHGPELVGGAAADVDLSNLAAVCDHVRVGGRLGMTAKLRHGDWFKTLSRCRVAGRAPSRLEHFQALHALLLIRNRRAGLLQRWERQTGIALNSSVDRPEEICARQAGQVEALLEWHDRDWAPLLRELRRLGFRWDDYLGTFPPPDGEPGELQRLRAAVTGPLRDLIRARKNEVWMTALEFWSAELTKALGAYPRSRVVADLVDAVHRWDADAYETACAELSRLSGLRPEQEFRTDALKRLATVAPAWAVALRERDGAHGGGTPPGDVAAAWRWRHLNDELERRGRDSIEAIQGEIYRLSRELRSLTARIIERRAWLIQRRRIGLPEQQALIGFAQTLKRIGQGTGRRTPEFARQAKELLQNARRAVPVWIMPLARVYEGFDPREHRFDVVIIDEASQADITALAAVYLGRKVIVVGDSEQVTPDAIGQRTEAVEKLLENSLAGIPNRHLYDGLTSVYDLAEMAFGGLIRLREHFRCVPDIIRFCNDLCYGDIRPLREPGSSPLQPALVSQRVTGGKREGKVNRAEAEAVAALVAACLQTPQYSRNGRGEPLSIGVISLLGDEQAQLIEAIMSKRIPAAALAAHRVLCGNAAQFQGDERDVIFASIVDSPSEDPPLSLKQDGAKGIYKKRFNVAVSRARDQLWVVHSLDPQTDLKPGDIRWRLIEHALCPGAAGDAEVAPLTEEASLENDLRERLVAKGHRVVPNWDVGAYRIALVVIGARGRLAIECDGERLLKRDQVASDMRRQEVLERLGWRFFRIRGSSFYRDPEREMTRLFQRLEELDIRPGIGGNQAVDQEEDLTAIVQAKAEELRAQWVKAS